MNWADILGPAALLPLLAATLRLAMPIILAAAGECLAERAGVFNLGLEGTMLLGAVSAFLATHHTGQPLVGAAAGATAGVLTAALVGLFVVRAGVDQVITGISVVLLGTGLSAFVYLHVFGITGTPPRVSGTEPLRVPLLADIPGLGPVLFAQSPLVYLSAGIVLVLWWVMRHTSFGLSVRAAGDKPEAADAAGISVHRTRWVGLLVSGGTAGLAGALVVDGLGLFQEGMTGGRGWVALAVVILARWNPLGAVVGGLMFGLVDAVQLRVQAATGGTATAVPYELFQALPYAVTLVLVVAATVWFRRGGEPRALGVPYFPAR